MMFEDHPISASERLSKSPSGPMAISLSRPSVSETMSGRVLRNTPVSL